MRPDRLQPLHDHGTHERLRDVREQPVRLRLPLWVHEEWHQVRWSRDGRDGRDGRQLQAVVLSYLRPGPRTGMLQPPGEVQLPIYSVRGANLCLTAPASGYVERSRRPV